MMLQDFIRMLNGKEEINEKLCFGIKTLRDTYYFKTNTKVDYENWWKEISSFVASPLKRTTSKFIFAFWSPFTVPLSDNDGVRCGVGPYKA